MFFLFWFFWFCHLFITLDVFHWLLWAPTNNYYYIKTKVNEKWLFVYVKTADNCHNSYYTLSVDYYEIVNPHFFCFCFVFFTLGKFGFFFFLSPKRWFKFDSRIVRVHFARITNCNEREMIAEVQSYIFRNRSRCQVLTHCNNIAWHCHDLVVRGRHLLFLY